MESFKKTNNILYGYYNSEKILKEVKIPDGIEHIDEYAFAERYDKHYEIHHLILPDSLKTIHKSAFWVKPRYHHEIPRADTVECILSSNLTSV